MESPANSPRARLRTPVNDFYSNFYGAESNRPGLRQWREITAVDKGSHIVDAWWRSAESPVPPTVVDIGCGEGAVAAYLSKLDFFEYLHGFEIADGAVRQARSRALAKTRFRIFDGEHIPAADSTYDLAILSHVLEHVPNPRLLLAEAARVATHVFIEVPLELTIRTPQDFVPNDVGHINLFNPLLIRQLIQSSALFISDERVHCARRANYAHRDGTVRGTLKWLVARGLLAAVPRWAPSIVVYQGTLLARVGGPVE